MNGNDLKEILEKHGTGRVLEILQHQLDEQRRRQELLHHPTMSLLEWAEKTARHHVHSVYHYGPYEECREECCIEARAILEREKKACPSTP